MTRSTHLLLSTFVSLLATSLAVASGTISLTLTEESDYEGPEDGPVFNGGCYEDGSQYEFEDCEDGEVDSLGLTLSGAFIVLDPSDETDSVDEDGSSLLALLSQGTTATLSFDAGILGGLPMTVGFMLTDSVGFEGISFDIRVTDGSGNDETWTVSGFGDDDDDEDDDEDRFVSIFAADGVASITLIGTSPIEIDHIQYSNESEPTRRRGDFDGSGTGDLLIHAPGNAIGSWLLDDTDESEHDCSGDDGDEDEDEDEDESEDELSDDWALIGCADLDNDCDADLVWRKGSKIKIWLMEDGKPDDKETIDDTLPSSWHILAVNDFDGNGTGDLLVCQPSSEKLRIWSMSGKDVTSKQTIDCGTFKPSKHALITTGDVDGDDCADIVWRRTSDGDVRGWAMSGASIQYNKLIKNNYDLDFESMGGGDTNGDGVIDLVFRSKSSDDVCICRLSDDFSIEGETEHSGVTNASLVAVSDIDGNGCDDLVWRKESSTGKIIRWAMTPGGVASKKTVGYVGNASVRVFGAK
jgi:hypothetical protein